MPCSVPRPLLLTCPTQLLSTRLLAVPLSLSCFFRPPAASPWIPRWLLRLVEESLSSIYGCPFFRVEEVGERGWHSAQEGAPPVDRERRGRAATERWGGDGRRRRVRWRGAWAGAAAADQAEASGRTGGDGEEDNGGCSWVCRCAASFPPPCCTSSPPLQRHNMLKKENMEHEKRVMVIHYCSGDGR